jgi:soluble lytic murein transglycosylase-like protein
MADDSVRSDPPVGLRAADGHLERRHNRRRSNSRSGFDRRRGERRKQRLRTLLFAAAALSATPSQFVKSRPLTGSVAVEATNFTALRPEQAYEQLIQEAARLYNISPALIRAVMRTESQFDPNAVSPVGAQGLMQLMPALAKEMGVTDPFDPRDNIIGGAKYLKQLLDSHRGNVSLTLASYNAGPGNVKRYRGIPPFKETRNYVRKITDILQEEAN